MRDEPPRDGRTSARLSRAWDETKTTRRCRGASLSRLDDACTSTIVNYENKYK